MGEVPIDGARQPFFDRHGWLPAQLVADAAGVDGVTQIMAGAVGDEADQPIMGCARGAAFVEQRADHAHQIDIAPLVTKITLIFDANSHAISLTKLRIFL